MDQRNNWGTIDLYKTYKETVSDCGKNASKEVIKQEFLYALKEIGEEFLKEKNSKLE